jgi:Class III signal peptide.
MIALQELIGQEVARIRTQCGKMSEKALAVACRMRAKMACERGQGTTEYAILVGVLVVIAILAITVFRPKLEELWLAISDGINSL